MRMSLAVVGVGSVVGERSRSKDTDVEQRSEGSPRGKLDKR